MRLIALYIVVSHAAQLPRLRQPLPCTSRGPQGTEQLGVRTSTGGLEGPGWGIK